MASRSVLVKLNMAFMYTVFIMALVPYLPLSARSPLD